MAAAQLAPGPIRRPANLHGMWLRHSHLPQDTGKYRPALTILVCNGAYPVCQSTILVAAHWQWIFSMAEITKLSVGQALEKLRGTDVPDLKLTRLDEKIKALDEEIQCLRAASRRIERDQRAGSTVRDAPEATPRP